MALPVSLPRSAAAAWIIGKYFNCAIVSSGKRLPRSAASQLACAESPARPSAMADIPATSWRSRARARPAPVASPTPCCPPAPRAPQLPPRTLPPSPFHLLAARTRPHAASVLAPSRTARQTRPCPIRCRALGLRSPVCPSAQPHPAPCPQDEIGRAHAELQSHHDLVCRLLLEKKKKKNHKKHKTNQNTMKSY